MSQRTYELEVKKTLVSTGVGYGASSAASKGYSGYMGRFIGYERRYNGKCTIYSRLYIKDGIIRKSAYKVVY